MARQAVRGYMAENRTRTRVYNCDQMCQQVVNRNREERDRNRITGEELGQVASGGRREPRAQRTDVSNAADAKQRKSNIQQSPVARAAQAAYASYGRQRGVACRRWQKTRHGVLVGMGRRSREEAEEAQSRSEENGNAKSTEGTHEGGTKGMVNKRHVQRHEVTGRNWSARQVRRKEQRKE